MWVFTSGAFVSIVQHRDKPDTLIVRGRFSGDVDRFLGRRCEIETPAADYRYRAWVLRDEVADALQREARDIDYPNFKDSIRLPWRKRLAMAIWNILFDEQCRQHPARKAK
jgi:hypothetical protein